MKALFILLSFLFAAAALSQTADTAPVAVSTAANAPPYYCIQMLPPSHPNIRFESGLVSCDLDHSGKATPQNICLEQSACTFITPDVVHVLESQITSLDPFKKVADMTPDQLGNALIRNIRLGGHDFSQPSTLVCKYTGTRCQTVAECQGPALYHMIVENNDGLQGNTFKGQGDGQILSAPVNPTRTK